METVNLYKILDTEPLTVIYHDLHGKARNAPRGTTEFGQTRRQLQRIRILLNQRGYKIVLTESGDGYFSPNIVPVVA